MFSDDLYINNSAYAQGGWRVGTTTTYVGKLVNNGGVLSLEATSTRSIGFRNTANGDIVRIDGINSRVGIGTTSPAFKLTVNSGADNTIARFASTDGTGTIVVADNAGSAYFSRLSNKIQIGGTSGDSALNLTVLDTGNVGIGDSAPTSKLSILASLNTYSAQYIRNSGTGAVLQLNQQGTGDIFEALDNSSSVFVIKDGGNVGIGTTSPSYKLDVAGSLRSTGESTFTSNLLFPDNSIIKLGTSSDLQILHDGSNSYINQTGTGKIIIDSSSTGINIQSGTGETRFTKSGQNSEIKVDDASQVNKIVLKANGSSYLNGGNVGIGTTSPSYDLDIQAESPAIRMRDISDANSFLVGADNSGGYLGMFTNDSLRVYTNSLERLRVDSSGNVGVGTTSPGTKLDVAGDTPIIRLTDTRNMNVGDWDEVTLGS